MQRSGATPVFLFPFGQFTLVQSSVSIGGAHAPSTAYVYNWNRLPVGQQLWLKELRIA
jgi:hypothetical protein